MFSPGLYAHISGQIKNNTVNNNHKPPNCCFTVFKVTVLHLVLGVAHPYVLE